MSSKNQASDPIEDLAELDGKTFALIVIEESGEGASFTGTARWDGRRLFFERADLAREIEISATRLSSVRRTTDEDRKIIGTDAVYMVTLTAGNMPDGQVPGPFQRTGLKWPGT